MPNEFEKSKEYMARTSINGILSDIKENQRKKSGKNDRGRNDTNKKRGATEELIGNE